MERSVADLTENHPGGLEGRDVLAVSEANGVVSATPIRAGGAESADMSLSDRERVEGFHLTITRAVADSGRTYYFLSHLDVSLNN